MNFSCLLRRFNTKLWPASLDLFISNSSRHFACKTVKGPPWNVLFFGTDNFALHSLRALWTKLNAGTLLSCLGVVSKPGSIVRKFAESEGLTVYDWPVGVHDINSRYHIGMVVSFGNLIPEDIIKSFPLGCINVHASLLPRWRGAAPIIHAVLNGDTETGITIMKIQPHKFDTGEIVRQYRFPIDPKETSKDVENKLGVCGSNLLIECLRDLPRCLDMAIPQLNKGITYAPKVKPGMAVIDWSSATASGVYNLYRALQHIYPLTTRWHGQPVKLHQLSLEKYSESISSDTASCSQPETTDVANSKQSALDFLASKSPPASSPENKIKNAPNCGHMVYEKARKLLKIICSDGNYVTFKKLSFAGKTMSSSDFYNGFLSKKHRDDWKFDS